MVDIGSVFHFSDGYLVYVIPPIINTKDEKGVAWSELKMDISGNEEIKLLLIHQLHIPVEVVANGIFTKRYPSAAIHKVTDINAHIKFEVRLNFDGTSPPENSGFIETINAMQSQIKVMKGLLAEAEENMSKMSYAKKTGRQEEIDEMEKFKKVFAIPIVMPSKKTTPEP